MNDRADATDLTSESWTVSTLCCLLQASLPCRPPGAGALGPPPLLLVLWGVKTASSAEEVVELQQPWRALMAGDRGPESAPAHGDAAACRCHTGRQRHSYH
jgi:hypothetical protein